MKTQNNLIAIFDSGSGGLITLNHLIKKFPSGFDFVYFADLGNMPYGEKTKEEIQGLTIKALNFLEKNFEPNIILNACNTSFASCFDLEQRICTKTEVFNIADSFVDQIDFSEKKILIISTPFTALNQLFKKIFDFRGIKYDQIFNLPCSELAFLTEKFLESNKNEEILKEIQVCLEKNLEKFFDSEFDFLIYGCSHYPHLDLIIQEFLKEKNINVKKIIDPSIYLANRIQNSGLSSPNKSKITFVINIENEKEKENFEQKINFLEPKLSSLFEKNFLLVRI